MKTPKFCRDCIFSEPEKNSTWNLRCFHPFVNCKDEWALSNATPSGSSAMRERELTWIQFPACGREGKLYEPRT